jgi:hypothetical protein
MTTDQKAAYAVRAGLGLALLLAGYQAERAAAPPAAPPPPALTLSAAPANVSASLPRELGDAPLGLGMTLTEARIRLPELRPDPTLAFAAPPTYYVCDEILLTHNLLLSRAPSAAAYEAPARAGGLKALEVYVIGREIAAVRALYDEREAGKVPYAAFIARAARRYGRAARAEALRYSDGTQVRYALWRSRDTAIVAGETAEAGGRVLARYVYLIDGPLLADSFERLRRANTAAGAPVTF